PDVFLCRGAVCYHAFPRGIRLRGSAVRPYSGLSGRVSMPSLPPFFRCVCVGGLSLILAACGAPTSPSGQDSTSRDADREATARFVDTRDAGDPVAGDHFVMHLDGEPGHLNPIVGNDGNASEVSQFIFDQVLTINPDTMEFEPHVAKAWEISDDNLTYTFYVRDDVRFHDGVPLTAHDVKFTFDKIMDPATDSSALRNYYEDIESLEVIDDLTFQFTMKRPYFRHLIVLGLFEIMPRHIYGDGDINTHSRNRSPVGSGPYRFQQWNASQQIVLTRNEDYPLRPVYLDRR